MGGWDGKPYLQTLLDKGVPFYAASQATKAYVQRNLRKRIAGTRKRPTTVPVHGRCKTESFCGNCYERSKGR